MHKIALFCFVLLCFGPKSLAQSYSKWVNGDTSDAVTNTYLPGLVLAGGGTDNDSAMVWALRRAGGGDVLIIRASGSNGYNSYLYSELGVNVNSVETIRFNDGSAAYDPYVIDRIKKAEFVFIAGGDQFDYLTYWRNSPVEDALNYLLNDKKITIGGTSAGMAILGQGYYAPPGSSLTSVQALANPYHPNVDTLGWSGFLDAPWMDDLVTDTHYDQRDRQGRHVVFVARLTQSTGRRIRGIACNEHTAVCVDGNGVAKVFGDAQQDNEHAYFLYANCQPDRNPEVMQPNAPLTWNRNQGALQVYKVPGEMVPTNSFDLKDWKTATGGIWENWYVENGVLLKTTSNQGDCDVVNVATQNSADPAAQIVPNPATHSFKIQTRLTGTVDLYLLDSTGQTVLHLTKVDVQDTFYLPVGLPSGVYHCKVMGQNATLSFKLAN